MAITGRIQTGSYTNKDGVKVYDIEFTHKGMEYEYEISAKTGKILSFEKDRI